MCHFADKNNRTSIGSDKMRMIVKKLCSRDPHQFFQRLETLARYEIFTSFLSTLSEYFTKMMSP